MSGDRVTTSRLDSWGMRYTVAVNQLLNQEVAQSSVICNMFHLVVSQCHTHDCLLGALILNH